ncbi:nucleotide exchange factor GrpE [Nocardia sp. SYP-A9097]|uniref:nucleotide exchange factor GrpE n=1 Tax=Nocardia sp. SYP-A9097 TaxID=2663237 RepID=UPI00129A7F44|nr:nucleotide exchange factor GrpE [Nocardia sp. SYP-A9097]
MNQPIGLEAEQVLRDLTDEIRRLNDRSESLEAINKRMHERVAALEADLLRASLRPVIKALAELHGECGRHAQHVRDTADTEHTVAFAEDFLSTATRIEDILEGLGAVTIGVEIGDPFDRRIHQPCGVVATEIETRHDRVSAIHHQGFRNISSDKPVIYAKVSVWKYNNDRIARD